jgi:F0F1-type ATP synthase membrane subunit b/b'
MFKDSNFYIILSFVGFLILLFKFGYKQISNFLDERIKAIKTELQDSNAAKEFALVQLGEETKALIAVEEEEDRIINDARQKAEMLIHNIKQEISDEIKNRQRECDLQIEKMGSLFEIELRELVADHIIQALIVWMHEHESVRVHHQINNKAIQMLSQIKTV